MGHPLRTRARTAAGLAGVFALAAVATSPVAAMDFTGHGSAVYAVGPIEDGDAGRFQELVASQEQLATVVLSSPGGRVLEAAGMADVIRTRGLRVHVAGRCSSACFLMFMAGRSRTVERGASVGVHSARSKDGQDDDGAKASTVFVARKAAELGATPIVIGRMVTTLPDGMSWLSSTELAGLGVRIARAP